MNLDFLLCLMIYIAQKKILMNHMEPIFQDLAFFAPRRSQKFTINFVIFVTGRSQLPGACSDLDLPTHTSQLALSRKYRGPDVRFPMLRKIYIEVEVHCVNVIHSESSEFQTTDLGFLNPRLLVMRIEMQCLFDACPRGYLLEYHNFFMMLIFFGENLKYSVRS